MPPLGTRRRSERASFALISTLLVLAILTLGVVAFLSAMRIERLTSHNYSAKTQAYFLAETGCVEALQRLERADRRCLVTAYLLQDISREPSSSRLAPYLVALEPQETLSGWTTTNYLFSSPTVSVSSGTPQFAPYEAAPSEAVEKDRWTDINAADPRHPPLGWIGLADPDNPQKPRTIPVPWLYVWDATSDESRPPIIGRYTFWIDDESSKLDILMAGQDSDTHEHTDGATPADLSLHGLFSDQTSLLRSWIGLRSIPGMGPWLFSPRSWLNLMPDASTASFEQQRHAMTPFSRADERGVTPRGMSLQPIAGYRRLDVSDFVASATSLTTAEERASVAENTRQMAAWITNGIPSFGQRYYERVLAGNPPGVTEDDAWRYTVKIAANIHDYIDEDAQPTVLSWDTSRWLEVDDPEHYALPELPPGAFGVEAVPNVQDYVALYMRDNTSLSLGHKFEIWNLHARPIETSRLGNARILMRNRAQAISTIAGGSSAPIPGAMGSSQLVWACPIPGNIAVPPGTFAVFSTLAPGQPNYREDRDYFGDRPNGLAPVAPSYHRLTNIMDAPVSFPSTGGASRGFRILGSIQNDGTDALTELSIVNDYGYLFLQPRMNQYAGTNGTLLRMNDNPPQNQVFIPGTLFGNDAPSTGNNTHRHYPLDSGDPRSFNHYGPQWDPAPGNYSPIATRRTQAQRSPLNPPAPLALGEDSCSSNYGINTANTNSLPASEMLPEPALAPHTYGTTGALSVLRDGRMRSIGELGHIYDPAIAGAGYYASDCLNRSGFRTLAIGTRLGEGNCGNNALSHISSTNRADLLMELFAASPSPTHGADGTNTFRGRININTSLRDPRNIALHALVQGLRTQTNQQWNQPGPSGEILYPSAQDPTMGNGSLVNSTRFVNSLVARMTNAAEGGPFMTLGELGRSDLLNQDADLLENVSLTPDEPYHRQHLDRGREEIFRRISNLICLKGSVFTLYLVAETGTFIGDKFVARGRCRKELVVETVRDYPSQDPLENLDISPLSKNNSATNVHVRILRSQTF
jgi:hypothetical protein